MVGTMFSDPMSAATFTFRHWRLSVADDPAVMASPLGARLAALMVTSQTPYDDLRFAFPLDVQSIAGFGAAEKSTAPGSRGPKTVTFTSSWRSLHNAMDVRPIADALEGMGRIYPDLGRPPIVLFQWAGYAMRCYLSADIAWEKGTYISGLPRGFTATLTLTKAVDRPLDQTRQGTQPSTTYHILQPGQTFEDVALLHLGDPSRGPLIRRTNPDIVQEAEGLAVKVLPLQNAAMAGPVVPTAVAFATGWEDMFEAFAAARVGGA